MYKHMKYNFSLLFCCGISEITTVNQVLGPVLETENQMDWVQMVWIQKIGREKSATLWQTWAIVTRIRGCETVYVQ